MKTPILIMLCSFLVVSAEAVPIITTIKAVQKPLLADSGAVIGSASIPVGTRLILVSQLSGSLLVHRDGESSLDNFNIPINAVDPKELAQALIPVPPPSPTPTPIATPRPTPTPSPTPKPTPEEVTPKHQTHKGSAPKRVDYEGLTITINGVTNDIEHLPSFKTHEGINIQFRTTQFTATYYGWHITDQDHKEVHNAIPYNSHNGIVTLSFDKPGTYSVYVYAYSFYVQNDDSRTVQFSFKLTVTDGSKADQ